MWIDSHQHIWALSRGDYSWLTSDLDPLYTDYFPDDYTKATKGFPIAGSVLVQAAPTVAETEFLLAQARVNQDILGVVGWIDFEAPRSAKTLSRLSLDPVFVGIRPMLADLPDEDWILRQSCEHGLRACVDQNLRFDALVKAPQIPVISELAQRHTDLQIVLDHAAKPPIASGKLDQWMSDIVALAKCPNVMCKFSGLLTEGSKPWRVEDFRPVATTLLDAFGPDRLIWGSDWPVMRLADELDVWVELSKELLAPLTDGEREKVFYQNAIDFYRLNEPTGDNDS